MLIRICLLVLASLAYLGTPAATAEVKTENEHDLLKGLESSDWEVRYQSIERLKPIPRERLDAPIKDKLIQLLEFETRRVWDRFDKKVPAGAYPEIGGEGFAEYYAALIGVVLNLHEKRALPALVTAASEPLTEFNAQLASWGTSVLKPALARLKGSTDSGIQSAMADILAHIIVENRDHKLTPQLSIEDLQSIRGALGPLLLTSNRRTRFYVAFALALVPDYAEADKIKKIFTDHLGDNQPGARLAALQKMCELRDGRFVPLAKVKELAEKDEFRIEKKTPDGKTYAEYPVRSLASQALGKFSRKGGPRDD